MRALRWIGAIAVGVIVVLVVTAFIGNRDKSGETVPSSEWAQSVCGAVGVWRGEIKAAVADVRLARAVGGTTEEPQSQTKRAGNSRVRQGLESAVFATKTMVTGIEHRVIAASIAPTARPYLKPDDAPCFGIACARSIKARIG